MRNHISLMLDSMFTAVEEGFSYDGIVSAPGTGLEDRPHLAVLLHDAVVRSPSVSFVVCELTMLCQTRI